MADATATTLPPWPVSVLTTHITSDGVEMVVTGKFGSLAIQFDTAEPTISFPDWERAEGKYKAVCALIANGKLKG